LVFDEHSFCRFTILGYQWREKLIVSILVGAVDLHATDILFLKKEIAIWGCK